MGLLYLLLEQEGHTGKYCNFSKYRHGQIAGFVEKGIFSPLNARAHGGLTLQSAS
jgi:hypothetical protein